MSKNLSELNIPNLIVENASFMFKPNFEGRKERYNDAGNRYFNLRLDPDSVPALIQHGWKVKFSKEDVEKGYESIPYLEVSVKFDYRPPTIILNRDGKETHLSDVTVAMLDRLPLDKFDVAVRPRVWQNEEFGEGVKAYLQTFYGFPIMDDILRKYSNQDLDN